MDEKQKHQKNKLMRHFEAVVGRAKLAILTEKTWGRLVPPLGVSSLFLSASWLGLWDVVPPHLRASGVGLFATALAATAVPLLATRWPSRREALSRLDANTGLPHRPATQFGDRLAAAQTQEQTADIWDAYRGRLEKTVGGFRAGAPDLHLTTKKDPYALRFAAAVLLVAASFAVANHTSTVENRIADAFDWQEKIPAATPTPVTAWVTPPGYTQQPVNIFSKSEAPQQTDRRDFTVPAGSTLTVNVYEDPQATVTVDGEAQDLKSTGTPLPGVTQHVYTLNGNANIYIQGRGHTSLTWRFNVTPDGAPSVAITGQPAVDPAKPGEHPGGPKLPYTVGDDYDGAALTQGQVTSPNTRVTGDPRQGGPTTFPLR
jgi:hypothetical protein